MKIAFWSYNNEAWGVTANLAAISVAGVIGFPYTIVAVENHLSSKNLGNAYFGLSGPDHVREPETYYYEGGCMEGLLRKIYNGDCNTSILNSYKKDVICNHLYYIPQRRIIHNEMYDYQFHANALYLFKLIEEFADICFIDTARHNSLSSSIVLEAADLIVINLCQNKNNLKDLLLNNPTLISKAIFIVSNCKGYSEFTSRRISRIYDITYENIIEIPYNVMFNNALSNGRIVEFVSTNYYCTNDNPNYAFIHAIKKAANMIIRKAVHKDNLKAVSDNKANDYCLTK